MDCLRYFAETECCCEHFWSKRAASTGYRSGTESQGVWASARPNNTCFQSAFPSLQFNWQFCLFHILPTLVLLDFKIFSNLMGVISHVVLICIFMIISGLSIFSYTYWSFRFQLLWNSCLNLLLIFLSGCLFLVYRLLVWFCFLFCILILCWLYVL